MILSFIVPFFNGGKYFEDCIHSLYNQDVLETEYEVVVVDDCSTDRDSIEKAACIAMLHPNMRLVHNEHNVRCGGSRNIGLVQAKGEYVWFVDQDDYIIPNCLGSILRCCRDNDLDILYFDYQDVSDNRYGGNKHGVVSKRSRISSGLDYIEKECDGNFWHKGYDTNVWHALYRKEFMIENNIFSPEVSYCEDLIVAQHAVVSAKRMLAVPDAYYCYRSNPTSVFHTEVGVTGRTLFDATLFAGVEVRDLSKLIPQRYIQLSKVVKEGGVCRINAFTKQLLKIKKEERGAFFEMAIKHQDVVMKAKADLDGINRWMLQHPQFVIRFPLVIFVFIKLCYKWH